jgi:hypothetical protein
MAKQRTATMSWVLGLAIGLLPATSRAEGLAEPAHRYAWQSSQRLEVAQADRIQRSSPPATGDQEREPANAPVSAAPRSQTADMIHYKPPSRGAPRLRVGGGTRASGPSLVVQTLAPAHVALTMDAAPTLYWYVASVPPESVKIEFTLLDEDGIDPVASFELPHPEAPGIQALRLADHGISVEPGIDYEWSIALVVDPSKRSHDVVSTAWLRRVDPTDGERPLTARELAERSLWYDALATLSDEIAAEPTNRQLREMRSSLIRQADLRVAIQ